MKTWEKFLEDNGLADITPQSDTGNDVLDGIGDLLRNNAESLRRILFQTVRTIKMSIDEEHTIKNLVGMIGNLKDKPHKKKLSDPMDDVVIRQQGGGNIGGGGGEE